MTALSYYDIIEHYCRTIRSNKISKSFYIIFLIRRSLLITAVMCFKNRYLQYASFIAINSLHFSYLVLKFPFVSIEENLVYCITDVSVLTISIIYSLFFANGDYRSFTSTQINNFGLIICYVIVGTNAITSLICIFDI